MSDVQEKYAAEQECLMVVPEAIDKRIEAALGKRVGFVLFISTENGIHVQSNLLPEAAKQFIKAAAASVDEGMDLARKTIGPMQ